MRRNVAQIATMTSPIVAERETAPGIDVRYASAMFGDWLKKALEESGIGQAQLARMLTQALGRSIDRAAVNKMAKGKRKIAGDELLEISRLTKRAAPLVDQSPTAEKGRDKLYKGSLRDSDSIQASVGDLRKHALLVLRRAQKGDDPEMLADAFLDSLARHSAAFAVRPLGERDHSQIGSGVLARGDRS